MRLLALLLLSLALLVPALAAMAAPTNSDPEAGQYLTVAFLAAKSAAVSNTPPNAWSTPPKRLAAAIQATEPKFKVVVGSRLTLAKVKPLTVVVDLHTSKTKLILWIKSPQSGHIFRLTASNVAAPVITRVR